MRFTLVYKGCSESVEGVVPPRIHRSPSRLVYTTCGESLKGVDLCRFNRMRSTLVYTGAAMNPWRV